MFNNNNNLKRMMAHTVLCKIKLLHTYAIPSVETQCFWAWPSVGTQQLSRDAGIYVWGSLF